MRQTGRGPSLFEAMTAAPEVQPTRPATGWRRRQGRRGKNVTAPVLAEPLTEEEAAAELAAQHREEPRTKPRPKARRKRATEESGDRPEPVLNVKSGTIMLRFRTAGCIAVVACLCVVVLGAYGLGKKKGRETSGQGALPAAAITKGGGTPRALLLPKANGSAEGAGQTRASGADRPDLSALLQQPPTREAGGVAANQPASVGTTESVGGVPPERLNHLQIESFRITRARGSEQLGEELADVQAFLEARGVKTFARRLGNGFVLFSVQGFPPGSEYAAERKAFRARIVQYGDEYRRSGGLYQFKGCLFVSHSRTRIGHSG